jgi:hypothetical protein
MPRSEAPRCPVTSLQQRQRFDGRSLFGLHRLQDRRLSFHRPAHWDVFLHGSFEAAKSASSSLLPALTANGLFRGETDDP